MRADPLKFSDSGLDAIIRDVLLPWYNSFRFFTQNANRYENVTETKFLPINLQEAFKSNKLDN